MASAVGRRALIRTLSEVLSELGSDDIALLVKDLLLLSNKLALLHHLHDSLLDNLLGRATLRASRSGRSGGSARPAGSAGLSGALGSD